MLTKYLTTDTTVFRHRGTYSVNNVPVFNKHLLPSVYSIIDKPHSPARQYMNEWIKNKKREKSFTTHFQSPALNHYNLLNETKMGHFRAVSGSSKSIQVKSGSATKWTFMNYSLPKVLNKIHHTVLNYKVPYLL